MASQIITFDNPSLSNTLTETLRKAIISGDFAPEERLSEMSVADRFGVARITAKASIDRLAADGILRRGQRKTAYVPLLSADDVRDLYFSREAVEVLAVSELARTGTVPDEARHALERMRRATANLDHAEHTEGDIALHLALVSATGSSRLKRMHDAVMGETQLCIAQVRLDSEVNLVELTETHAAILTAIASADVPAAVSSLLADLHGCRDTLVEAASRDGRRKKTEEKKRASS